MLTNDLITKVIIEHITYKSAKMKVLSTLPNEPWFYVENMDGNYKTYDIKK